MFSNFKTIFKFLQKKKGGGQHPDHQTTASNYVHYSPPIPGTTAWYNFKSYIGAWGNSYNRE